MATSAIPSVIDALVALGQSVETITEVFDGFSVTNDPGDFLMVGVDDPDNQNSAQSADSQQNWASNNPGSVDETGQVTCAALSWNGNGDLKAARDAAFATCAAVANGLRSNPTLGLPTLLWARYGSQQSLTQDQTVDSAQAIVVFQVYFRARI